jgi:putative ABC transport system permease protein
MTSGLTRFYHALLHLYPSGFRVEYQHELTATFADKVREYSGPLAWVRSVMAAFGDVVPNAASVHWEILQTDLRYAARSLRRTPGFAVTAVLVVALGVGANTAAFSLADYVLLRPLSFPEPDQLVKLWQRTPGYGQMELSPPNYRDWKAMTTSVSEMAAYTDDAMNLVGTGEPRRLDVTRATPDFFQVLGVPAFAGRAFAPTDSVTSPVLVLSYALWQTHFGSDPRIVGKVVRLEGSPYTIIGVMPASFRFPSRETEAWVPLLMRGNDFADRTNNLLEVIGRLRSGVSVARANLEVAGIAARLERQYPKENEKTGGLVVGLRGEMSERARLLVLALCGATICVLLLACANLASLLLTRAAHRTRELAVRAALGAGRERLIRQLVTESIGLAVVGGVVGVALAAAALPLLARLVPSALPTADQPTLDWRVMVVAAVVVIVTGLAFGVGPAIGAGRSKGLDALRAGARAGGGRTQRARAVLVIVEVAASVVLLVSSGLLIRAVLRIQATDPGFQAENVLTLRTALPSPRYDMAAQADQFYDRVLQNVRALPGVEGAAYMSGLPMIMRGGIWPATLVGNAIVRDASNSASLRFVTPQLFGTLRIPIRGGRDVAESDTRATPLVAVVSESFAKRMWPNESAIGKQFNFVFAQRTVVGVVGDVRVRGLERPSEPQVYLPARQLADSSFGGYRPKDLVVRATVPTATLLPAIRRIIMAVDAEQPISSVQSMTEIISDETTSRVTQLRLLGALSAIALLIAGIGIHGLLAFAVTQRARELGVRRALGEQATSIVRRVLREGLTLAIVGVTIGVFVAYLAARAMGALLAGVQPGDPATLAAAAALCLVTAIIGCVRPAARAARVDPITALRGD